MTFDPAPFDPAPFYPAPFDLGPALLFCPADRPDRFAKALDRADAVILDLEDAVAAENKTTARAALAERPLDPARVVVRVNPPSTPDFAADLAALAATPYRRIMVAKADAALPAVPGFELIALCETAAGVLDARDLACVDGVITELLISNGAVLKPNKAIAHDDTRIEIHLHFCIHGNRL